MLLLMAIVLNYMETLLYGNLKSLALEIIACLKKNKHYFKPSRKFVNYPDFEVFEEGELCL